MQKISLIVKCFYTNQEKMKNNNSFYRTVVENTVIIQSCQDYLSVKLLWMVIVLL
nr:CPPV031 hypothetical protein [Cooks petrelpox virus]